MIWFRRRLWYLRAVIALTAVVTPLCIACNAWEPLLGCADQGDAAVGEMASMSMAGPDQDGRAAVASIGVDRPHSGVSCECISCHGGTPLQVVITPASSTWALALRSPQVTPLVLALLPPVPPPPILV